MKKFFAAALAVLAFVSCSTTEKQNNTDNGKAYVKFELSQGITRATENATATESVMGAWSIYVFNANKNLIKVVDVASGVASDEIELTVAKHYFLFAINKPTNFPAASAININDNIDAVEKTLMTGFADMSLITTPSASSGTDFYITNVKREEITLPSGTSALLPHTATISVGRAMAKSRLNPITVTPDDGGTLTSVGYIAANNPVEMHTFPHHDAAGQLITPFYSAAYAAANYFPTVDATTLAGLTWAAPSATDGIYLIENSNSTPAKGNSSMLVIKGDYAPSNAVDKLGAPDTYTAGDDFWRVYEVNGAAIVRYLDFAITEAITTTAELEAFLDAVDVDGLGAGGYTVANFKVDKYTGGETFYSLYLGDGSQLTAAGRYTVARNYLYNVTINQITGPGVGDPALLIDVPTKPLEESAFIKFTITVAPWELINQGGILGN